jgi:hypothetical protein
MDKQQTMNEENSQKILEVMSNTQQLIFELRNKVQDVHFLLELLDQSFSLAMDAKQE